MEPAADLIRQQIKCLSDLEVLEFDPKLRNIDGSSAGKDLFIVNEFYKAIGFRKIHLEIARFGPAFEILHCVFFPDPTYDLPIFGVDIVSSLDVISAAIVDLSPVDTQLPKYIQNKLTNLFIPTFKNLRKLPDWGNIFSPHVQFLRPHDSSEFSLFLTLVDNYLDILISHSLSIKPNSRESPITIERYNKQKYYCQQQKCNDKTRIVLTKIFGPIWADQYINFVLFDCPESFLDPKD